MIPVSGTPHAGTSGPGSSVEAAAPVDVGLVGTFEQLLATLVTGTQGGEFALPMTGIVTPLPAVGAGVGAESAEVGEGEAVGGEGEGIRPDVAMTLLLAAMTGAPPLAPPAGPPTPSGLADGPDGPQPPVPPEGESPAASGNAFVPAPAASGEQTASMPLAPAASTPPGASRAEAFGPATAAPGPKPAPFAEDADPARVGATAERSLRPSAERPVRANPIVVPEHGSQAQPFQATLDRATDGSGSAAEGVALGTAEVSPISPDPRAAAPSDGVPPPPREEGVEPSVPRIGVRRGEQGGSEAWVAPAREPGRGAGPERLNDGGPAVAGLQATGGDSEGSRAATRRRRERGETHSAAAPAGPGGETGGAVPLSFRESMPAVELSRREEAAGALSGTSTARVVEAARTAAGQGGVEVQVRLHPEALGDVRVTVRWDGGVLSARLDVNTLAARDALQGSLQSLRATLHEQGVPVERLDVNLRMDLNGGARERESGRQTGPSAWMPPDLVVPEHDNATAAPSRSGRLDVRI